MIDETCIKEFLPIQELERLQKTGASGVIDLSANDLFLISKMLETARDGNNAKAVSLKVAYKDLIDKISSDLSIQGSQTDVSALCAALQLSAETLSGMIGTCSGDIMNTVNDVSSTIALSVDKLSTDVDSNYTKIFTGSVNILSVENNMYDASALVAKQIDYDADGHPFIIQYEPISNMLTLDGLRVATGAINPSYMSKTSAYTVNSGGITSIEYAMTSSCYLICRLSVVESDAVTSPVEVWLKDGTSSRLIDTFNNPGGFSGTEFTNYYRTAFPLKIDSPQAGLVSVCIKYPDPQLGESAGAFKNGTTVSFDEYQFYAVAAVDDLNGYVPKAQHPQQCSQLSLYKFMTDSNGLVINAVPVNYDYATASKEGFIKLCGETWNEQRQYGLNLDNSHKAYVKMPFAGTAQPGVIKTGTTTSFNASRHSLSTDVQLDSNGKAYCDISAATDQHLGAIKLSGDVISVNVVQGNISASLQYGVQSDAADHAFVKVPVAGIENFGVVKTDHKDSHSESISSVIRHVFTDNDGCIKVDIAKEIPLSAVDASTISDDTRIVLGYDAGVREDTLRYVTYHDFLERLRQDLGLNNS